jgi:hypothetical protein
MKNLLLVKAHGGEKCGYCGAIAPKDAYLYTMLYRGLRLCACPPCVRMREATGMAQPATRGGVTWTPDT